MLYAKADNLLIVGTSLQIGYTLDMLQNVKTTCKIVYIDPEPANYLDNYGLNVKYIRENAVSGVNAFVNKLHDENNEKNR
jgi:NAD-dependent SIR2 family protein deacetylase